MVDVLSELLKERDSIAARLANWRKRWDIARAAQGRSIDNSISSLRPLDEYAFDLAYGDDQGSPSLVGGGLQDERRS